MRPHIITAEIRQLPRRRRQQKWLRDRGRDDHRVLTQQRPGNAELGTLRKSLVAGIGDHGREAVKRSAEGLGRWQAVPGVNLRGQRKVPLP
jgi:hypothetical protein